MISIPFVDKLGFVILLSCDIKLVVQSYIKIYVVLKVHLSKVEKNEAHILVDKFGRIQGNNPGAIQVFELDDYFVSKRNITEIFPMIEKPLNKFEKYIGKNPQIEKIVLIENNKPKVKKVLFNVVSLLKRRFFAFKIWDYYELRHNHKELRTTLTKYKSLLNSKSNKGKEDNLEFQFRLSKKYSIKGSFIDIKKTNDIFSFDNEISKEIGKILFKQTLGGKGNFDKFKTKKLVDFAEGIRVKRLVGELIRDVYEEDENEFLSEEEDEISRSKTKKKVLF